MDFRSLELEIDGKLIRMMRDVGGGASEIENDVGERLLPELERMAKESNDPHKLLIFTDLQTQFHRLQDKQSVNYEQQQQQQQQQEQQQQQNIYYQHESDRIYKGQKETEHIITMATQAREKLAQQGITVEGIKEKMINLYRSNAPRLKSIFRGVKMGQRRETVIFAIFCAFLIAILLWAISPSKQRA